MKKLLFALSLFISFSVSAQRMLVLPDTPRFANQNKGVWVLRVADNQPYFSNGNRWVLNTGGISAQTIKDSLDAFFLRIVTSYNNKKGAVKGIDSIYFDGGGTIMYYRYNGTIFSQAISGSGITDSAYILAQISDSLNANRKRLLGFLVNNSTITSISNYTNTGLTSPVASGGKVNLVASANNFTAHLAYNYYSLLERWYQKIPFKIIATATNGGIGIGMQSANNISLDKSNVYGYIKKTASSTKMYIVSGYTGYGIFPIDSLTIPDASFQNSDSGAIEFERVVDTMYLKFKNFTQNTNYALKAPLTDVTAPNTGQYAIFNIGGTYDVYGHTISSNEVVGAQLGLIGDSKLSAFGTGISNGRYRYGELLGSNFPYVVISGGPADKTTEVLLRIPELIALGFKQTILSPGCNDIRGGMLEAEYEYNYDSITRALSTAGTQVFHEYYYEGAESFQPTQVAWLKATYPNNYINTYDELKNTAGSIVNSHPSDLGHQIIAKTTIQSYKLNNAVNAPVVTYQFPQKIHADTKVDLGTNNLLWYKIATKTTEDTTKTSQFWVGDSINRNIFKWTFGGLFNTSFNGQANAALVISKTKRNNNENVDLLSMVTADAPTKNGWHFQNLTGVAGYVIPRMITYGLADPGYVHLAFCKYSGMNWQVANYDSADLAGKIATYQPINSAYSAYTFYNAQTALLDILGSGRGTITGNDWRYAADYSANYTDRSLVDKGYVDRPAITYASGVSDYTPSASDKTIITNGRPITLPTSVGIEGKKYIIKNAGVTNITIDAFGTQKIDDDSLLITLQPKKAVTLQSDFIGWRVISDAINVTTTGGGGSGYTAAQIDSIARLAIADSTHPLQITQSIGANRIFFKANDSLMKFHSIEADSNITIVARIDANGDTVWKIKAKPSIDSLRMISDSVMRVYNNAGYTYDLSIPGKANTAGSSGTQTIVDTAKSLHATGGLFATNDGDIVLEGNGAEINIGAFPNIPVRLRSNNAVKLEVKATTGNIVVGSSMTDVTNGALVINSTTKALVLPRMTKTQRDAIGSPIAGMMVYQTDNTPGLRVYNGTNWMRYTETAD